MDVLTRNFFRLLRAGAFAHQVEVEPLSAWKWKRLYQLAAMHGVSELIAAGMERCGDQFFVSLAPQRPANLDEEPTEREEATDESELLTPTKLTNPLLNHKLQAILDDERSNVETRQMLLQILRIARYFMNEGFPFLLLVELGQRLQHDTGKTDFISLKAWLDDLRLTPFARLESSLLVGLLGFKQEDVPFASPLPDLNLERMTQDVFQLRKALGGDWYFKQGDDIFVHSSGSMLGQIRRSTKYFHYYPSEALTNFFSSFVHSLSHIEE